MFAYCRKCEYDTGDYDEGLKIINKIIKDGGAVEIRESGEIGEIKCPVCKSKDSIRID